jgi:hypothetical protein
MPHFGLIDDSLSVEEAALLRARLHVRGANIRLARGQVADAIAAYYDAFSTGMELNLPEPERYREDKSMFQDLADIGILEPTAEDDFEFLERTLDDAIEGAVERIDLNRFLEVIEPFLMRLGIIPFAPDSLPQEEAVTT